MMREPEEGDRLVCPCGKWSAEVSPEDLDATMSEAWNHVYWDHALPHTAAQKALAQMVLEDRLGNIVKES